MGSTPEISRARSASELRAIVDRFRDGFWHKQTLGRPLLAVLPERAWLPIMYLKDSFPAEYLEPGHISPGLVRTDYEDWCANRTVRSDDFLPYVAAWRAAPWLELICGCRARYSQGSFTPEPYVPRAAALALQPLPGNPLWLSKLQAETLELARNAPSDCWVSPTILRGASDVIAAMRGMNEFCLDLYDDADALRNAAHRIAALHAEVLQAHFDIVPPKLGGFGHIYGYWAPGPTTVLQEDAMGLCSPRHFRQVFFEKNAELVSRLGPYVLFHLHSTGCKHYEHVLEIPGLAGIEITIEQNGPKLLDLVPVLRQILERSRLILFIDGHFDQLDAVLAQVPREGLYLILSGKFVPADEEFRRWTERHWPGSS